MFLERETVALSVKTSKKGWMTGELFAEWMRKLDSSFCL